jgi:hypothetical protein
MGGGHIPCLFALPVRGRPVNTPSRRPQTRSIRAISLPDTTVTTTCNFVRSVLSMSGE